jgi:phenylalanyl-tRNA synthetase alpha chain
MTLYEKIKSIQDNFNSELSSVTDKSLDYELLYNKYLGRKGLVSALYSELGKINNLEKPKAGEKINSLKNFLEEKLKKTNIKSEMKSNKNSSIDLTLPGNH